ncbi:CCR4-NOT transcription complex subunit 1 [Dermatophagoides pteronyssinus]|uniref:CCR4-NOT transcription complex subunit 1 n=1 Tax=Dermatophagoides pteronyssinus TaxID=6956 RepID=A0ABQ8JN24_DERPT|nr:CCR4-NOT transcription complex subunit 1 [Dermatophagoides pteronyssinus]
MSDTNNNNNNHHHHNNNNKNFKLAVHFAQLGNDSAIEGDFIDAVKYYSKAIDYCPENHCYFGFYLNRALCLIKMDFFYLALPDTNQAVRLSSKNYKCYYIRSRILRKLKHYELAQNDLKMALNFRPTCKIIREESERIIERNEREFRLFNEKLKTYNLNDKTYYKIKVNFHLIKAQDLPTNIWNYNGIRVENIRFDAPIKLLKEYFSLFGNVEHIKRTYGYHNDKYQNQNQNQSSSSPSIFIYYYNPVTPMFTIAYFQGKIFEELCRLDEQNQQYKSLRLYFAPTDHQIELKYHRPNHPSTTTQECYFWRTTFCHLKERCPKFHLQPCKNIDAQIWMFK